MQMTKWMLTGLLVMPVLAAGADRVTVRGAGTGQCRDYLEMRRMNNAPDTYQVAAWVQGFLAGHNVFAGAKDLAIPDVGSTLVELDRFCQAHNGKSLSDGAMALAQRLGAVKQ